MKISTKGRYALRLMLDLALSDPGVPVPLRDVAQRQDISDKYLEQIVTPLSRAGLVRSVRGAGGGYLLTRDPAEYTVGEILRPLEGSLAPVSCVTAASAAAVPTSASPWRCGGRSSRRWPVWWTTSPWPTWWRASAGRQTRRVERLDRP